MAEDPLGMPELREVIHRLYAQSRDPNSDPELGPDEITAIANHLYHGTQDGTKLTNPGYWRNLALTRDHIAAPEVPKDWQAVRDRQWAGWQGPGWSAGQKEALGRDPQAFELSPGDQVYHQWLRDNDYLEAMLNRRRDPSYKNQLPFEADMTRGPRPMRVPETVKNYVPDDIEDALYWYRRGKDATHSVSDGANFKRYGGPEGTFHAMENPDYTFGWLNTAVFSPIEYAANRQTMRDLASHEDPEAVRQVRGLPGGNILGGIYDFARNAMGPSPTGSSALDDAGTMLQAKKYTTHSPVVPSSEKNPSAEDRVRLLAQARKAMYEAGNHSGTDYQRAKTGHNLSFLGSLGTSLSSALLDPSTALTGAMRGGKFAAEFGEEAWQNGMMMGAMFGFPKEEGLHLPPVNEWLDSNNRPDIKAESKPDFDKRIQSQEKSQTQGLNTLRNMLINTPDTAPRRNYNYYHP